jgi:hypothetical protein
MGDDSGLNHVATPYTLASTGKLLCRAQPGFLVYRAGAASAAAASAAEQQTELGQEDVRCEIGVRAAGVEPAALGHVHAQRDVEEQQRDGDGGSDEQQERVERQQGRTEPDSTAEHVELGRVDEQVLQDGEWQQQQQECGGGGGDEEHEKQEQPSSGAEGGARAPHVSGGGGGGRT